MNFREYINYEEFESKKYEFKEIVSHKNYEKWLKEIAAFSNTEGGKLFFGVDDDENIVGITKEQAKIDILYINDICDKKLHPRVKFDFNKIKVDEDKFVIEIIIFKNENLPVWMTRSDEQDVIYIRRDGQSVLAHGDQIEDLVLLNKRKPFDTSLSAFNYFEKTYNDLNELFYEHNDPRSILTLKDLKSIDAVSIDDFISNGLLLFADDYDGTNCNVTCRTWPGLSKGSSDLLDKKEFKGNMPNVLNFAKNYISLFTKTGLKKLDSGGHIQVNAYPERAVEEALINAVAHRDYYIDGSQIDIDIFKNRIQICSPGSFLLPGNAQDYKLNNIPSRRRNEVICAILEKCKFMEKSGSGFDKIVDAYIDSPEDYQPKAYSDPAQFIITLFDLTYKKDEEKVEQNYSNLFFKSPRSGNREYDKKILDFCLNQPKSRVEIQNYLELSDRKSFVNSILNPLLDCELLLTTQMSVNAPNQKYYTNKDKVESI